MKVWELEDGVEYIRKQDGQNDIRYIVEEGLLKYFSTYHNAWYPSMICYNDIKDVELEETHPLEE